MIRPYDNEEMSTDATKYSQASDQRPPRNHTSTEFDVANR
jgi:hypothetical protein